MSRLASIDLAAVDPCPGCGEPVRRFAHTPIRGQVTSGPWWCPRCIQTCAAARGARRSTADEGSV